MSSRNQRGPIVETMPDLDSLAEWAAQFKAVSLDLGAGDARFAREQAIARPTSGVIAIDTCGANAGAQLRRAPGNLRFLVTDAVTLPEIVISLADECTINFPWGNLLTALVNGESSLLDQLTERAFTVRVNAGALSGAGFDFEPGVSRLRERLEPIAGRNLKVRRLERDDLRQIPTTWAKRLAFGRDPRAIELINAD